MGLGKGIVKRVLKATTFKSMMEGLDSVPLESLTVDNLMEQYKVELGRNEKLAMDMETLNIMCNFTDEELVAEIKERGFLKEMLEGRG